MQFRKDIIPVRGKEDTFIDRESEDGYEYEARVFTEPYVFHKYTELIKVYYS